MWIRRRDDLSEDGPNVARFHAVDVDLVRIASEGAKHRERQAVRRFLHRALQQEIYHKADLPRNGSFCALEVVAEGNRVDVGRAGHVANESGRGGHRPARGSLVRNAATMVHGEVESRMTLTVGVR
jgi:hypothetical protein